MYSLSKVLKVSHKNGQNRRFNDIKCEGYQELQKYHGTTVKRSYDYLKKYILDRNIIYKEHILPIKQHIVALRKINHNIVVLIRNPYETIESYRRVFSVLPEVNVNFEKLYEEVKMFYNVYMALSQKENNILIVTFRDVVFKFHETMKKIIEHYGFKIPDNLESYSLDKRNFTGHGLRKIMEEKI
jgi:hypothetical protein